MPYDIIPFFIIIISFLAIIFIIGRKWSALKVIDIDTVSEEKESKMKKNILELRLKRNFGKFYQILSLFLRPFFEKMLIWVRHFYYRILELEKKYKDESRKKISGQVAPEEGIYQYLQEAQKIMKTEDVPLAAEELYIKVIEIDNKNIDAYKGLFEIYLRTRDFRKAKEVARYLLRLSLEDYREDQNLEKKHNVASCYARLGEMEQNLENASLAIRNYKEALKIHPNNPKFLDLLLKVSIIEKDKKLARSTLQRLKIADPENQKIIDLEKEVEEL